jgi:hypothetical protein
MGSITVCPIHIFPPPAELLVCYQPHRQEVMPGQKSIYETFLDYTAVISPARPHKKSEKNIHALSVCVHSENQFRTLLNKCNIGSC